MRKNPSARRTAPIRLIPYGPGPSAEIAVYGSLAVALDSGPPPRLRPPLGLVRPGTPDVTVDAQLIARLVVEVLAGVRPYHHLAGRTTPSVFERLDSLAARLAGRRVPRLRTVRVCSPAPDVAEVTAIAAFGPRVQALALRLERYRDRWRCAAIETTVPPARP